MKVFQYLLFCITLLTFTSCVYNNLNRNHYLLSPDESLSLTLHGDQKNISYSFLIILSRIGTANFGVPKKITLRIKLLFYYYLKLLSKFFL